MTVINYDDAYVAAKDEFLSIKFQSTRPRGARRAGEQSGTIDYQF